LDPPVASADVRIAAQCSPPLMDERTNVLPINSLDFRYLSWPARRAFRCATVLHDRFDIFSAWDGASYRVEH
jgi:hypothetical protein